MKLIGVTLTHYNVTFTYLFSIATLAYRAFLNDSYKFGSKFKVNCVVKTNCG